MDNKNQLDEPISQPDLARELDATSSTVLRWARDLQIKPVFRGKSNYNSHAGADLIRLYSRASRVERRQISKKHIEERTEDLQPLVEPGQLVDRRVAMKRALQVLPIFIIVASILGFVVDAMTLVWWFINLDVPGSGQGQIPIIDISIQSETAGLLVLLYTLLVFGILGSGMSESHAKYSKGFRFISGATIPLFFIWGTVFEYITATLAVIGIFFWASVYFGFLLIAIFPPAQPNQFLVDENELTVPFLARFLVAGILITPLAAAWLHDSYMSGWGTSLALAFVFVNFAWLMVAAPYLLRMIDRHIDRF